MDDIWATAALLPERRRAPAPHPLDAAATALGTRRLERWQRQPPFDDPAWFGRRLRSLSCSADQLANLLGEPANALMQRIGAPWLAAAPNWSAETPIPVVEHPLDPLLRPWLVQAAQALQPTLRPFVHGPKLLTTLLQQLAQRHERVIGRTLALELHIASERGQLQGSNGAARFANFIAELGQPAARTALLEDYPCLAQQLTKQTQHWISAISELLKRLQQDRQILGAQFGVAPDELHALRFSYGDSHGGGRNVARLEFANQVALAYKPRPQALAVWFQGLLELVNQLGWDPAFRQLHIADRGAYGWIAWEEPLPCSDSAAVTRFYRRLGGLLGLLTVVQATDMHFENIVAVGEHPLVIDCETLLHPPLPWPAPHTAFDWLHSQLNNSVLRCGLLPQRHADGPELSGIGGKDASQPGEAWVDYYREGMRIVAGQQFFAAGHNQPHTSAGPVDPLSYWEDLEQGCVELLELAQRARQPLSRQLEAAAHLPVRCVPRPSQVYAHLREQNWHPSVLVRGLERQLILDRLWIAAARWPWLSALIPAEQADLAQGDIPLFTSRPGARRLWSSRGARINVTLPATALERAQEWLARLDPPVVAEQQALLRSSAVILARQWQPEASAPAPTPATRRERLAGALRCAAWLEQQRSPTPFGWTWHGVQQQDSGDFSTGPLTADYGAGLAGIALFFALLQRCGGGRRWGRLAVELLEPLEQQYGTLPTSAAWFGTGGVALALLRLAQWLEEPQALTLAARWAQPVGAAATPALALAWLELWQATGNHEWLTLAQNTALQRTGTSWLDGAAGAALLGAALADHANLPCPAFQPTQLAETLALWPWQPQPALLETQVAALLETQPQPDWHLLNWAARIARRADWAALAARHQRALADQWRQAPYFATPRNTPAPGLLGGAAGAGWALLSARSPLAVLSAGVLTRQGRAARHL